MKSGNASIVVFSLISLIAGCSQAVVKKSGAPLAGGEGDVRFDAQVEKAFLVPSLPLPACILSDKGGSDM